jgi:hypothetical protein
MAVTTRDLFESAHRSPATKSCAAAELTALLRAITDTHTTRDFAVEFITHGHRIRALSLDLAQTWQNIHAALMQIVAAGPAT